MMGELGLMMATDDGHYIMVNGGEWLLMMARQDRKNWWSLIVMVYKPLMMILKQVKDDS